MSDETKRREYDTYGMSGASAGFQSQQGPFPGSGRQHAGKYFAVMFFKYASRVNINFNKAEFCICIGLSFNLLYLHQMNTPLINTELGFHIV